MEAGTYRALQSSHVRKKRPLRFDKCLAIQEDFRRNTPFIKKSQKYKEESIVLNKFTGFRLKHFKKSGSTHAIIPHKLTKENLKSFLEGNKDSSGNRSDDQLSEASAGSLGTSHYSVNTNVQHFKERRGDSRLRREPVTSKEVQKARKLGEQGGFTPSTGDRLQVVSTSADGRTKQRFIFASDRKTVITVIPTKRACK